MGADNTFGETNFNPDMEKIEFNGKEFKGSEGNFTLIEKGRDAIGVSVIRIDTDEEYTFADVYGSQANARLFAGSKNLLKAAIEAHEKLSMLVAIEAIRVTNNSDMISEHMKNHPTLLTLENAINECL